MTGLGTQIVSAVLDRLSNLHVDNGGYVKTLKPSAGRLQNMTSAAWQKAIHDAAAGSPAIWVALDSWTRFDGTVGNRAQQRWLGEAELSVSCWGDSRESLTAGRLDPSAASDPGLRKLTEDALTLLAGWTLGISSAQRLNPVRGHTIVVAPEVTAWEWLFTVKAQFESSPLPTTTRINAAHVQNVATDAEATVITEVQL